MNEYFWEITQFDGTVTQIPPNAVEVVKRRMANNEPINTTNMVIPANQIRSFRQTDKQYSTTPLLEAASQAFNEPMLSDGGVVVRWVKRCVTNDNYNKHYSKIPAYRRINELNGMTVVAFKLPVHLISSELAYCTDEEINKLGT